LQGGLSWFFSRSFLLSRSMLWLMFIINFGGTVYGYIWYEEQLIYTSEHMPAWYLPFVPDSPTASLFFTLSLIYLLWDSYRHRSETAAMLRGDGITIASSIRGFIEAFAFVTSFKYGIWAVAVIVADSYLGSPVVWQDWMLSISHTGMAVEVLLYGRFYRYGWPSLALVSVWSFWNDFMDYHQGTVPTLSYNMMQYIDTVEKYTIGLSIASIALAAVYLIVRKRRKV
jgi:uncharacterized membrane protein YpjA